MKYLGLIAILFCLQISTSFGQKEVLSTFIDSYKSLDHVSSLSLSGFALKLASKHATEGEAVLNKITALNLLILEKEHQLSQGAMNELIAGLCWEAYEDLLVMQEADTTVRFFIKENNNRITDVLMLAKGQNQFVLIHLAGDLSLDDLYDLEFDVQGGDHFKKIPRA